MKRLNKYRALDPNTKEYVYFEMGKLWEDYLFEYYRILTIARVRFEQFINKYDKNGKEIYEGDKYIESVFIEGKRLELMCIVVFNVDGFMGKWEIDFGYVHALTSMEETSGYLPIFGNLIEIIKPEAAEG